MRYYCTLFDSAYLTRGLALYESLLYHEPDAFLCFFCFDSLSSKILKELNLKQSTVVSLSDFETERLLAIKSTRNKGEYCWTCKATAITYVLENFQADTCTYLDADLYLFSPPKILLNELENSSVLITPHRFSKEYDTSYLNGLYSAQYLTFKNDKQGRDVLNWWNDACINWCFGRHEDGKYGDQKYLEQMSAFPGVKVSSHLGIIGPWNMQQFDFFSRGERVYGKELKLSTEFEIIFFHFHDFKFQNRGKYINFGNYKISQTAVSFLYKQYSKQLFRIDSQISSIEALKSIDTLSDKRNWKTPLRFIKGKLTGVPYILKTSNFLSN